MSGGQRQRIGIARLLYHDPMVMIFDEGFSALDEYSESNIFNYIKTIKTNKIIIFITHDKEIEEKCDINLIIKNQKINIK